MVIQLHIFNEFKVCNIVLKNIIFSMHSQVTLFLPTIMFSKKYQKKLNFFADFFNLNFGSALINMLYLFNNKEINQ